MIGLFLAALLNGTASSDNRNAVVNDGRDGSLSGARLRPFDAGMTQAAP